MLKEARRLQKAENFCVGFGRDRDHVGSVVARTPMASEIRDAESRSNVKEIPMLSTRPETKPADTVRTFNLIDAWPTSFDVVPLGTGALQFKVPTT